MTKIEVVGDKFISDGKVGAKDEIARIKQSAFEHGIRSSDYASHTALNTALDYFIRELLGVEKGR